jgi:hypothetical protein
MVAITPRSLTRVCRLQGENMGHGLGKVNNVGTDEMPIDPASSVNIDWTRSSNQRVVLNSTNLIGMVWMTAPALNSPRHQMGAAGSISSAIAWSGFTGAAGSTVNEKWSGSSWATTTSFPVNKVGVAYCGTVDNALSIGGGTSSTAYTTDTYIWGSNAWATTSALAVTKIDASGCGSITAALCCGGYSAAGGTAHVQLWNGSSWATTTVLPSSKYRAGCVGSATSALSFGGYTNLSTTFLWNGSTWASTSTMVNGRSYVGTAGDPSNALAYGGTTGSNVNYTEQWNGSSWSTTSSLNNAHYSVGVGITSAAMSIGGSTIASTSPTEIWAPMYSTALSFTDPAKPGDLVLKVQQPSVMPQVQVITMPSNSGWYYNKTLSLGAIKLDVIHIYFNGIKYYCRAYNQNL